MRFGSCAVCGRLDPWDMKPCYCQRTTMETKEKDVVMAYEHVTVGHPFGVKACRMCQGEDLRNIL